VHVAAIRNVTSSVQCWNILTSENATSPPLEIDQIRQLHSLRVVHNWPVEISLCHSARGGNFANSRVSS
jgi:hypothetical protein